MSSVRKPPSGSVALEGKGVSRDPKYYSRAIGKALEVLAILKSSSKPLSFNDLLRKVKLVKSSLFRIVYTLESAGYITKADGGLYSISPDVVPMVDRQFTRQLVRVATPYMAQLNREFRETVSLGALLGNHVEVVAVIESVELVRMSSVVGRILPPHASSLGKSITAFQSEDLREKLVRNYGLSRFTSHTITDETLLREEYARIRTLGYSGDIEETTLDGCCFATPIFVRGDTALSGISVSLPKIRLADRQPKLIAGLQAAAKAIAKGLS